MADEPLPTKGPAENQKPFLTARERSLANLKPIRPGQCLNPSGNNGFKRRQELIAKILREPDDEPDAIEPGKSRIRNVVLAMARAAKDGDAGAGKTLIEQFAGKARQQVEIGGPDGGPITMANLTTEELRKMLEAQLAQPDVEETSADEPPSGTGEPTT